MYSALMHVPTAVFRQLAVTAEKHLAAMAAQEGEAGASGVDDDDDNVVEVYLPGLRAHSSLLVTRIMTHFHSVCVAIGRCWTRSTGLVHP